MGSRVRVGMCVVLLGVGGEFAAAGGGANVAFIHFGVTESNADFVRTNLEADPRISSASVHAVDHLGVPNLATLMTFDSILISTTAFSKGFPIDNGGTGTQLGNVLDDYVTNGGRVVFSGFTTLFGTSIDGDIEMMLPFDVVISGSGIAGLIDKSSIEPHPVFSGVHSFDSSFAGDVAVSVDGEVLARYESFLPAVLTNHDDSIMLINAYAAWIPDYSNGSDFGLLFANALTIPAPATAAAAPLLALAAAGRRRRPEGDAP